MIWEYKLHWPLKYIKNKNLYVKFDIFIQTKGLSVEKYCLKNFERVLHKYEQFSLEDMAMLNTMKMYIKSHIGNTEKEDIMNFLFLKNWFNPLTQSLGFAKIEIENYDAKLLENKAVSNLPFLHLEGWIILDIVKTLGWYIQQNILKQIRKDNKFIKETIDLGFIKPLPPILIYENSPTIKDIVLQLLTTMCNTQNKLSDKISKENKMSKFHTFKKQIRWIDDNTIRIIIDDWPKLLKMGLVKHWVPLTLGGIYLYAKHKQNKKKEALMQSMNIYSKMLDVAEKMVYDQQKEKK